MAEPTQYSFELAEVAKALMKEQGIHEGVWLLAFEFNVGLGVFGPSPNDSRPGAMMQINRVQLARQPDNTPESAVVLNAAKANPAPSAPRSRRK